MEWKLPQPYRNLVPPIMPTLSSPRRGTFFAACQIAALMALWGLCNGLAGTGFAQNPPAGKPPNDGVTVNGRFVDVAGELGDFDLSGLTATLTEMVDLQQPELPPDWNTRDQAARVEWLEVWRASPQGKQIMAANQAKREQRFERSLQVDRDGQFTAYDVPRGSYLLQAAAETTARQKTWSIGSSGRFEVGDVEVLDLAALPLSRSRLLKSGETAPPIEGTTIAGQPIRTEDLRGRPWLLVFALVDSPSFVSTAAGINAARKNVQDLQVLVISLDKDRQRVAEILSEQSIDWPCLAGAGWQAPVMRDFGVQSVPSMWLIDQAGLVRLTGPAILEQMGQNDTSLGRLLQDGLDGGASGNPPGD